ncbi:MAG: glycoside hydrolase family 65 protein [Gilvibacter sp.]
MNQEYITVDPWSIIEEGYNAEHVKASESLFSIGNGAMGQRANFEEDYSGPHFQGSYIGGVYYPDKTRVGWWKNGYPEYFAKVLNAPNWIGIHVKVNGEELDLHACTVVSDFRRELNMKEGWYQRSFTATLVNGAQVKITSTRILSLSIDELGIIKYELTPLSGDMNIQMTPYLDAGITNEDTNWDDKFWDTKGVEHQGNKAFIRSMTMKTEFDVCTFMQANYTLDGNAIQPEIKAAQKEQYIGLGSEVAVAKNKTLCLLKYAGYVVSTNHPKDKLIAAATKVLQKGTALGFDAIKKDQIIQWEDVWRMADITIEGDDKAQQGIRFNIFQLNQTYSGKDARLNIGPKGFTGEKYGGSTYWDTEAYCIPFYMATKNKEVARNLLVYRYNHLDKAIENAQKLGFTNGAALYPMVTMNGEESHNEWEITFEEIHRNGAIAFAIFNYVRYTGDYSYIPEMGIEVLIAIARFWQQRATFSNQKQKYVILGVTGPNEYENNVNNNWYTNYTAVWCIEYALQQLTKMSEEYEVDFARVTEKAKLSIGEMEDWRKVSSNMYFPFSEEAGVFLQQDGFLDKELIPVSDLAKEQRPINQNWSWDRILRSVYIKQADVLQGFYFFEDHFSKQELEKHFDFYEPFTVHESSLSPCVHSIQAAKLDRMDQAYTFYVRTARLDLDDYNKEVEEGCHITSMAGSWMSIVEGFAGMRVQNNSLSFEPKLPQQWEGYRFKVNFRDQILSVHVQNKGLEFMLTGDQELNIAVDGETVFLRPNILHFIEAV